MSASASSSSSSNRTAKRPRVREDTLARMYENYEFLDPERETDEDVFCSICSQFLAIRMDTVQRHSESERHRLAVKSKTKQPSLFQFGRALTQREDSILSRTAAIGVIMGHFLSKHIAPSAIPDIITPSFINVVRMLGNSPPASKTPYLQHFPPFLKALKELVRKEIGSDYFSILVDGQDLRQRGSAAHVVLQTWRKTFLLKTIVLRRHLNGDFVHNLIVYILRRWNLEPVNFVSWESDATSYNMKAERRLLETFPETFHGLCVGHCLCLIVFDLLSVSDAENQAFPEHFDKALKLSVLVRRIFKSAIKSSEAKEVFDSFEFFGSCHIFNWIPIRFVSQCRALLGIAHNFGVLKNALTVLDTKDCRDALEMLNSPEVTAELFVIKTLVTGLVKLVKQVQVERIGDLSPEVFDDLVGLRAYFAQYTKVDDATQLVSDIVGGHANGDFCETLAKKICSGCERAILKYDKWIPRMIPRLQSVQIFHVGHMYSKSLSDAQWPSTASLPNPFRDRHHSDFFSEFSKYRKILAALPVEQKQSAAGTISVPAVSTNEFWATHGASMPLLFDLAKKWLCVSITSSPLDRKSIRSRYILTPNRSLMDDQTFENEIWIGCNAQSLDMGNHLDDILSNAVNRHTFDAVSDDEDKIMSGVAVEEEDEEEYEYLEE